jgi:PhnB protein
MKNDTKHPPHSPSNYETLITMTAAAQATFIQPYLFFDGRCEEALEFYKTALGAEVIRLLRFKDSPESAPGCTPLGSENKIMHAQIRIGDTVVMVSDGRCTGKPSFEGFSLSLTVPTEAEADRFFDELEEGGQVVMPLAKTFFSPRFGMVTDRFGVMWMILTAPRG